MGFFSDLVGGLAGSITANPLSAITSIGSMIGGFTQQSAQKAINEQNIAMQRETNALQEKMFNQNLDWQRESQQIQNDYNDIGAQIARAEKAGLSPHAVLGGAGSVAAGSGAAGSGVPALTAPHANMVDSPIVSGIAQYNGIASALQSLSQSGLNDAQKDRTYKLLQAELNGIVLDNDSKKWKLDLAYKFDDKFKQAEYDLMISKNALQLSEINLNEELTETQKYEQMNKLSDSLLKDMQRLLTKKEYDFFEKKWEATLAEIKSRINLNAASARYQNVQADDTIATRQARVAALNSQTFQNMAAGRLSHAQAEQIEGLTPLVIKAQELANQATSFTNAVLPQKLKNEIDMQLNELKRQNIINEQEGQRLEMLQKENNLYYYKEVVGMFTDVLDTAAEFMPYKFPKLSVGSANVHSTSNINSNATVTNIPPSQPPRNPIGFGAR